MSTQPVSQTTAQQVLQIVNLIAVLEPAGLALIQSFMKQTQGATPTEIAAAADAIYAEIGQTAQAELDKLK